MSLPTAYTTAYRKAANQSNAFSPSPHDRDALIAAHLGKVKYIADRYAARLPASIERDDIYGAGVLGLLDAVERFDAGRGVAFTTFAEMRVRGAILDSLRGLDWASRGARKRHKDLQNAYAQVEQKLGRAGTEEEVAAHLKISVAELHAFLNEASNLQVTDLDAADEETGVSLLDSLFDSSASPLEQYEIAERKKRLAAAIERLPERERQVVALYYVEELTMKEIGACLSVTESRVSQLRTQAIVRLRAALTA